jgi:hypothetical protein
MNFIDADELRARLDDCDLPEVRAWLPLRRLSAIMHMSIEGIEIVPVADAALVALYEWGNAHRMMHLDAEVKLASAELINDKWREIHHDP